MTDLSQPAAAAQSQGVPDGIPLPLWLLAELTYRCPLHCAFCYNPIDYTDHSRELSTEQWLNVLREARALGAA
jgi:PqqA peptide cyclase